MAVVPSVAVPAWLIESPPGGHGRQGVEVSVGHPLRSCPMVCHFCLQACASSMLALLLLILWGSVSGWGFPVLRMMGLCPIRSSGWSAM